MTQFDLSFPYAHGAPTATGLIRSQPEDFIVQELFTEQFSSDGEHHYLLIEKRGENTHWLVKQLAQYCGVDEKAIGFAGLKDRNALTQQWFSVQLPGRAAVDWHDFNHDNWKVLKTAQHSKKLRRGDHLGNRFIVTIRNLAPGQDLQGRLEAVQETGVPNYFGEQRFGRDGENLNRAQQWLVDGVKIKNRRQKGFVLSAARSYLFNQLLAKRVELGNWNRLVAGDIEHNQSPTGPLWGRGRLATAEEALTLESAIAQDYASWCDALEHQGLSQERRPLCLQPSHFSWQQDGSSLQLNFILPPGQFATAILRELVQYSTAE